MFGQRVTLMVRVGRLSSLTVGLILKLAMLMKANAEKSGISFIGITSFIGQIRVRNFITSSTFLRLKNKKMLNRYHLSVRSPQNQILMKLNPDYIGALKAMSEFE